MTAGGATHPSRGAPPPLSRAVAAAILVAAVGRAAAGAEAPPASPAAAAVAPRTAMTLAEALALADASPDLLVARAAQAVAERSVAAAKTPLAPSLSAASHTVTSHLALSLAVPVRWGGQRSAAVDVAQGERDAAAAATASALDRAREETTAAWLRLAADEELEGLALERVRRLERTAAAVQDLFDAGRVPRLDVAKARAEAAAAHADVFSAAAERRASGSTLAFLVGAAPTVELSAAGERPAPGPLPGLDALLRRASASPDLVAAEARSRAAAARLKKAKRDGLPGLTLEGGVDFDDPTVEGTDKHLSLGLTIPIGARAAVDVSSAGVDLDAVERAKLRRLVESQVVATWGRVEAARQRLEALDASTLPAAVEAAELARVAYREGRSDLLRLLESERALVEARAGRIETWVSWGTQRASLERLVGGLP